MPHKLQERNSARGITLVQVSLLFSICLAVVLASLFSYYQQRLEELKLNTEAEGLLRDIADRIQLARGGFISSLTLPASLAGNMYELKIEENKILLSVQFRGGEKNYSLEIPAVEACNLAPACEVFFFPWKGRVKISENLEGPLLERFISEAPPEFYFWSKENPESAVMALYCYFYLHEQPEACGCSSVRFNNSLAKAEWVSEDFEGYRVRTIRNVKRVNSVDENLSEVPPLREALEGGWIRSPADAMEEIRSRDWRDENGREVQIPANLELELGLFIDSGEFPVWQVGWDGYRIYIGTIRWWWAENSPGFLYWAENLYLY